MQISTVFLFLGRRIVVILPPSQLQQVPIGVIDPVGRGQLHRPLPFRLLNLPVFNVQLDLALLCIAAAPHLDGEDFVLQAAVLQLLKVLVHDQDGLARVRASPETFRVAADVRVQVEAFGLLLQHHESETGEGGIVSGL